MNIERYKIPIIAIAIALLSACGVHEMSELTKYDSVQLTADTYKSKFYSFILLEVTDEQRY